MRSNSSLRQFGVLRVVFSLTIKPLVDMERPLPDALATDIAPLQRTKCAGRDWLLLPSELVVLIAVQLRISDIARLPAVCRAWSWALGRAQREWPPPPPTFRATFGETPWLLLPNENGKEAEYCNFLPLSEKDSRVPRIRISPIPEMAGRICVGGSPDGWIVTVDLWLNPRILNPLTKEEFSLPSIFTLFPYNEMSPTNLRDVDQGDPLWRFSAEHPLLQISFYEFQHKFIRKIILSSAPPHGIAFLIHGLDNNFSHMAIARIGDLKWSPGLDAPFEHSIVSDVVYNKKDGKFYIIFFGSRVVTVDLEKYNWGSFQPIKATNLGDIRGRKTIFGYKYVVFTTSGDLLQVWRESKVSKVKDLYQSGERDPKYDDEDVDEYDLAREETIRIKVFKFNPAKFDGQNPYSCWIRVKDLGDDAIFIGFNHSICITTIDKPWLRKNSVYFTEDSIYRKRPILKDYVRDVGIYDLKHKKIEWFFSRNCKDNWPPPTWFIPSCLNFIL